MVYATDNFQNKLMFRQTEGQESKSEHFDASVHVAQHNMSSRVPSAEVSARCALVTFEHTFAFAISKQDS